MATTNSSSRLFRFWHLDEAPGFIRSHTKLARAATVSRYEEGLRQLFSVLRMSVITYRAGDKLSREIGGRFERQLSDGVS